MTTKRIELRRRSRSCSPCGGLLGGVLYDPHVAAHPVAQPAVAADQALAGFSLGDTESLVRSSRTSSARARRPEDPRPARARLPAAGPRDGRSDLLREVPRAPRARRSRWRRTTSSQRAGSARSRSRDTSSDGARVRREGACISPTTARTLRSDRRRAARARPLRGGVPGLRHDGRAEAEPRRLLACLVRARAAGRRERAIDAMELALDARAGIARADGLDARPARASSTGTRASSTSPESLLPAGARRVPRLRVRARCARAGRGRAREPERERSSSRSRQSTRSRFRSSSPSSATCTRTAGRKLSQRPVRPHGRHRPPPHRERCQRPISRRRSTTRTTASVLPPPSSLRGWLSASGRASTGTTASPGHSSATVAVRRRSAHSQRALRLGTLRRVALLPPRDDRALPRRRGRGDAVVHGGARAEPALLAPVGTGGREGGRSREEARRRPSPRLPPRPPIARRGAPPTRSATSRSTSSAASSRRATASACSTSSTSPRSRPFQAPRARSRDGADASTPPRRPARSARARTSPCGGAPLTLNRRALPIAIPRTRLPPGRAV